MRLALACSDFKAFSVLLSQFKIACYMTDAWRVYRTLLASTSHIINTYIVAPHLAPDSAEKPERTRGTCGL